jgi:hypothetical protein
MDFIIGLLLFIIIVLICAKLMLNTYSSNTHLVLYRDAVHLSDNLLSYGYPTNWTSSLVILPGIAGNNRINTTQLEEFDKLEYSHTKNLMHVTSDYIFFIRNSTSIVNINQCTHGHNISVDANCNPIMSSIAYNDLVRVDRLVLYDSKVVTLTIYAWD